MKLPRLVWRERPRGAFGWAHVFDREHDTRMAICRRVQLDSAQDWRIISAPEFPCRDCEKRLENVEAYADCRP
jgi:hypothetical protein